MVPAGPLSYRTSGVDVDANNEANERIKEQVLRTHDRRVITKPGLFGGVISLAEAAHLTRPWLVGVLGSLPAAASSPEAEAGGALQACFDRLQGRPVAFLDYTAAARLDPVRVETLVEAFAAGLDGRAPIMGGETAELPGVLRDGAWEVVAALFGLAGEEDLSAGSGSSLSALGSYVEPALALSMDSVGTKTKLGVLCGSTAGLAQDIIHHSLNDILCQGARGTALLAYIGCHTREQRIIRPLLDQFQASCAELKLDMLDLQVVEKPRVYREGEIDVCAVVAGLLDAERVILGRDISVGDPVVGLRSSGLHTNGYSLARKALLERGGLCLESYREDLGETLAEALLRPHRNYASCLLPLLEDPSLSGAVKGIVHVTGGGLRENLVRILPLNLGAEISLDRWQPQPIFRLIQNVGQVPLQDPVGRGMYETFNMGIGLVLILDAGQEARVRAALEELGEKPVLIGRIAQTAQTAQTAPAVPTDPATRVRLEERIRLL